MRLRQIVGGMLAGVIALLAGVAPALAEGEPSLLPSLLGDWKGKGKLVEPTKVTEFECRMTMSKGNRGKVVFRATCPLVAASGGMAFNAEGGYELALTSSTDLKGSALGAIEDGRIVYVLEKTGIDKNKNELHLKATLAMGAEAIDIDFTATWNGEERSGSLDFLR